MQKFLWQKTGCRFGMARNIPCSEHGDISTGCRGEMLFLIYKGSKKSILVWCQEPCSFNWSKHAQVSEYFPPPYCDGLFAKHLEYLLNFAFQSKRRKSRARRNIFLIFLSWNFVLFQSAKQWRPLTKSLQWALLTSKRPNTPSTPSSPISRICDDLPSPRMRQRCPRFGKRTRPLQLFQPSQPSSLAVQPDTGRFWSTIPIMAAVTVATHTTEAADMEADMGTLIGRGSRTEPANLV